MLRVNDVTLKFGGETLFDGLDVTVHAGHKAGIVGRNGIACAKRTRHRNLESDLELGSFRAAFLDDARYVFSSDWDG